jgi:glycine/D-amino acid oxidase-like deaminating enzyme
MSTIPSPPIAVIGAGIVGAATAFRLAEKGAAVVLLDRDEPGSAATAASFAGINAAGAETQAAVALCLAAIQEHHRLAWKLAPARWYHSDGALRLGADPGQEAEIRARVERLREWGYAAEILPASVVRADLEPALAIADPEASVAWFANEGWVDAPAMTRELATAVRNAGGRVLTGEDREVVAIGREGDRIASVTLAGGQTVPVAAVVNAAGASAGRMAALVGRDLPMTAPGGIAIRVETREGDPVLRRPVLAGRVAMRPAGPGHVWLVPLRDAAMSALSAEPIPLDDPLVSASIEAAADTVPALAGARPIAAVGAAYAVPASGYLSAGPVPEIPGYYEVAAYSGVTLAPLLARSLADDILGLGADPLLAPFRPDADARSGIAPAG